MRKLYIIVTICLFSVMANHLVFAEGKRIFIAEPANGAKVTSPVKICMGVEGLILEPASEGVNEGAGHHHILFSTLPVDLSKPLGKGEVHLSDASTCRSFAFTPGRHVIIALFSYGNHVPYNPPITDKIMITVKQP